MQELEENKAVNVVLMWFSRRPRSVSCIIAVAVDRLSVAD